MLGAVALRWWSPRRRREGRCLGAFRQTDLAPETQGRCLCGTLLDKGQRYLTRCTRFDPSWACRTCAKDVSLFHICDLHLVIYLSSKEMTVVFPDPGVVLATEIVINLDGALA